MRTNDRFTREELRTALQQAIVANDADVETFIERLRDR